MSLRLAFLATALCGSAVAAGPTLLWADEFGAAGIDTSVWGFVLGDGTGTAPGVGWGNAEYECYTGSPTNAATVPSPLFNDTGNYMLNITAVKYAQPPPCNNGPAAPVTATKQWTSAKLTTQASKAFVWSAGASVRIEARIKVPVAAGAW